MVNENNYKLIRDFQDDAKMYHLELQNLNLTAQHLIKTLGYKEGNTPSLYLEKIDQHLMEAKTEVKIRVGFKIFPPEQIKLRSTGFICGDVNFKTGKIIGNQLMNSETVALFAGTAGPAFDQWSRELFENGDFPGGYVVDVIGSEIVEASIDWLENQIYQSVSHAGKKITNRFSPGYCGWNVIEQFKLFSQLPDDFCGISLTQTALMVPIKSVSGVIGVGDKVEKVAYPCDTCQIKNCYHRRKDEAFKE